MTALQDEARGWLAEDPALARLTDRQRELTRRLAAGEGVEEIAAALGITSGTVKNHVYAIRDRLGRPGEQRPPRREREGGRGGEGAGGSEPAHGE